MAWTHSSTESRDPVSIEGLQDLDAPEAKFGVVSSSSERYFRGVPIVSPYDPKAVTILFHTHWGPKGWKKTNWMDISPGDFDYAVSKGVMFPPIALRHDDAFESLRDIAANLQPVALGEAFLFSLSTRNLAYRSALGSYAACAWMPAHVHSGPSVCQICGEHENRRGFEDLNPLNFERLKWGGVRHNDLFYQLFDLREFKKLAAVKATPRDRAIFRRILEAASSLPYDVWCGELEKALSGLFPSSKAERRMLLQILSYCGIIAPTGRPGYFRAWPAMRQRAERPVSNTDWTYPIVWWQGRHGYNRPAIECYFPGILSVL
jgi:hypothetical protein